MALERRLKTVRIMGGGGLLRQYTLGYANNSFTGRSQLGSVTECDGGDPSDGDPPVCLNALEFDWTRGSASSYQMTDTDVTDVARSVREGRTYIPGDINGDGLDDLIYRDLENNWKLRFSTGEGFSEPHDAGIPSLGPDAEPRVRPIDFDRDGRLDLMVEVPVLDDITQFALYRSTGSTYEPVFTDIQIFTRFSGSDRIGGLWAGYFVDLDGNGLPDYVGPRLQRDADGEPDNRLTWTYRLNLGSGFGPYVDGITRPGLSRRGPTSRASTTRFAASRPPVRVPDCSSGPRPGSRTRPSTSETTVRWAEGPLNSTCPSFASRRTRTAATFTWRTSTVTASTTPCTHVPD